MHDNVKILKCTVKNGGKGNILGGLKNGNLDRMKTVSPERSVFTTWMKPS